MFYSTFFFRIFYFKTKEKKTISMEEKTVEFNVLSLIAVFQSVSATFGEVSETVYIAF